MNIIFDKFKDILNKSRESKQIISEKSKLNLSRDFFKNISPLDSDNFIVFVDGGNGEIASSSDFSLHFSKIAVVHYRNNKRVKSFVRECFILAYSVIEDNVLFFNVDCIDAEDGRIFDSFKINARDKSLKVGNKPIEPCSAVLHVRKLLEIKKILELSKDLESNDVVVRDGDFDDGPFISDLILELKNSKPNIIALSKTSTILTDSGDAAVEVLLRFGEKGPWVYNDSSPCFVKLNSSSDYVFKVEFIGNFSLDVLNKLVDMSSDPVFLGYPYGLVAVDALARVDSSLLDIYKALFESIVDVSQFSRNAHDILNKIA
jgi:hypothetical protein